MHDASSFVTLTYDDDHLPDNQSLELAHWQRFAKQIRDNIGPFRYFHCGEYGSITQRPHLHAILFGVDFHKDRRYYRTLRGHKIYTSEKLDQCWTKGQCKIGEVTFSRS